MVFNELFLQIKSLTPVKVDTKSHTEHAKSKVNPNLVEVLVRTFSVKDNPRPVQQCDALYWVCFIRSPASIITLFTLLIFVISSVFLSIFLVSSQSTRV